MPTVTYRWGSAPRPVLGRICIWKGRSHLCADWGVCGRLLGSLLQTGMLTDGPYLGDDSAIGNLRRLGSVSWKRSMRCMLCRRPREGLAIARCGRADCVLDERDIALVHGIVRPWQACRTSAELRHLQCRSTADSGALVVRLEA